MFVNHSINNFAPKIKNLSIKTSNVSEKNNTLETSLSTGYKGWFLNKLKYELLLKGNLFYDYGNYSETALSPTIKLSYLLSKIENLDFVYTKQYQFLHNTGLQVMGLPSESWVSSSRINKPQYVHSFQLLYNRELFNGKYNVNVNWYYKRLYNQLEYCGSILDFLTNEYSLYGSIIRGWGYNYGVNVSINKCTGKLTGWLSASYGRAKRQFDVYGNDWFSANHERPLEFNVVAAYKVTKSWNIGATFVYASGTPFTQPKYFYVVNGNLISDYGRHNANRLAAYVRLDLSANYDVLKKNNKVAGVNFSLYNVLMRDNEIYYGLRFHNRKFVYEKFSFFTRILPSISFYYKF